MNHSSSDVDQFVVVKSATGRWSYWPVERALPEGWQRTSMTGSKQVCLDSIRGAQGPSAMEKESEQRGQRPLRMSLMFFGDSEEDAGGDKYRLLIEAARFADRNGFRGIWLPERHFTKFGCLYPSPSVLHAALARETNHLRLCAGSVVLPLNDPVRVAEQWSVVDNLSHGRVEIAFASGWHADDFSLMPDAYQDRVERMFDGIELVDTLWRGGSIQRQNGAGDQVRVRTYPTPIQKFLPVWLTAAGNPETFRRAGRSGYSVLTHLFHQDTEALQANIEAYRAARREVGLDDTAGHVGVTLHTFVADSIDSVVAYAKQPYCRYLRSNLGLLKQLAFSHGQSVDVETLPPDELDQMLGWLFDKFVGGRSLMGSVATCEQMLRHLADIGVDEVACLMDFGPDPDDVLDHLSYLAELNEIAGQINVGFTTRPKP